VNRAEIRPEIATPFGRMNEPLQRFRKPAILENGQTHRANAGSAVIGGLESKGGKSRGHRHCFLKQSVIATPKFIGKRSLIFDGIDTRAEDHMAVFGMFHRHLIGNGKDRPL